MGNSLDIYVSHFGLTERPFNLVPDPSFLFWSDQHRRAYAMLEYGILTHAPVTLVTGEIGAGKTTLLYHLLSALPDSVQVGFITNSYGDRGELVRWVLMALGQEAAPGASYVDLFQQFQTFLIKEYSAGRRTLLIFDEAQNLSRESLEELRMFTNINSNKDELLQIILVGQPELRDIIRRPDMVQLAQRISSSFHLPAMNLATVHSYITHRLRVAGAIGPIFSEAAMDLIHEVTRGVPRLVNQLCDLSLVYAFTKGEHVIPSETVKEVLADGLFFGSGQPNGSN